MKKLFTIGHGVVERSALLSIIGEKIIIDVRSRPFSRWNPSCNMPAMKAHIPEGKYFHYPELGGLDTVDAVVRQAAIEKVRALLEQNEVVLMCSESDVNQCHRKFLAVEITGDESKVEHLSNRLPKAGDQGMLKF